MPAEQEELSGEALRAKKRANFLAGGEGEAMPTPTLDFDDIVMTPSCTKRIKHLNTVAQKEDADADPVRLRLFVEGGGCSGFSYNFELDSEEIDEEEDRLFGPEGGQLVVDETSFELLKGSTVDFTEELIGSSFKVLSNPQAEAGCGCGTSFSLKE